MEKPREYDLKQMGRVNCTKNGTYGNHAPPEIMPWEHFYDASAKKCVNYKKTSDKSWLWDILQKLAGTLQLFKVMKDKERQKLFQFEENGRNRTEYNMWP